MINVLFVCYGNICRSPMAEFLFKKFVSEKGESENFYIESAATSSEEVGNPVYPPARRILNSRGIDCSFKRARKIKDADYENFDYIICMDKMNEMALKSFFYGDKHNKVFKMLDFTDNPREVADPWYTGDFDKTYNDIMEGINGFYGYLKNNCKKFIKN
ncbi:MAG: low molecular weight protein-tyrosine-phosphatase [Clostridia bacterium]|nr:low molecular weight protein-tyrosine-phosphatase [Clostridia bacterium]